MRNIMLTTRIHRLELVWPAPGCPGCGAWSSQVFELIDEEGVVHRSRPDSCLRCGEVHAPALVRKAVLIAPEAA